MATEALNTASAIAAEAAANWSRPPPDAHAHLLEVIHTTGREVFDLRVRIRAGTLVPDETTAAVRLEVVVLLDRLADATSEGRMPDVDAPDPETWPADLEVLGAACRSTHDRVLTAVAESRR